ncbi:hypothetical protein [Algibacter lectus]|uniref:YD repeat-containing protein n=1 Tax=Algibacter lectus TaxID=221126 RepID=A0A090VLG8_9FLAO|nr:hypothetical protein [Algibacter lectus]MDO7138274.1 hypothetical protein [Algibacter lectus]MWW26629.1 hypothetical protein [Algibacter lectus]TDY59630.1 hypothetical protein DFQ06_3982 [Algibacter lectus]SFD61198.1 hypothetical protein SAMN04489722_11336 [Algibacter lectus]GAL64174.1 hypothetical protein JCM19300_2327 [Algibacter lectus]
MKRIFSILSVFIAVAISTVSCSSSDDSPALSSLATITDFSITIDGVNAEDINYDLGTNIDVTVPFGTSLTAVVPTISVSENATVSPVSGEEVTFVDGEAKTFTVTAEDGITTKDYTVTVSIRGEVGSGSKLETYVLADLYGENSTTTYTYNEANFVSEYTKVQDDWGDISTTVYTLVYNDKNQVIEKTAEDESTVYTYEDGQIVKSEYKYNDELVYTYTYSYNANGDLSSEKRTDHTSEDAITEVLFTIVDGNVTVENRFGDDYTAAYDTKNNPFKGLYPAAYAAINVGIASVNTNNPVSGTLADDVVTYEYNADDYPTKASYTYFDGFATVEKTFTYYSN